MQCLWPQQTNLEDFFFFLRIAALREFGWWWTWLSLEFYFISFQWLRYQEPFSYQIYAWVHQIWFLVEGCIGFLWDLMWIQAILSLYLTHLIFCRSCKFTKFIDPIISVFGFNKIYWLANFCSFISFFLIRLLPIHQMLNCIGQALGRAPNLLYSLLDMLIYGFVKTGFYKTSTRLIQDWKFAKS